MTNVRIIAPLLAHHFIADESFYYEQSSIINDARLGAYYKYLNRLEDSWVVKTEITAERFVLTLNDFATHVFADALVERKNLKIDHSKLVFPVQINFKINILSFNNVDEDGSIHPINEVAIDEYLDEQIISISDDSIEIGLVVWKKNKNGPGQHILILVNAKDVRLNEEQEIAWKIIFDNDYIDYYKYFRSQFEAGRYVSDQAICAKIIDEFDSERS